MKYFIQKIAKFFEPSKNLVLISLAFWITHILLRVMLLFRSNPYGFPFVSKPDWFIFHAVCIDFMWICNALVVFMVLGGIAAKIASSRRADSKIADTRSAGISNEATISKVAKITTILYTVFHSVILLFTLLDNEVQRFLGGHLSFGLVDTYKDTSSIAMFYDYVANDLSIPYLQFVVLALMLPLTYGVYKLLFKHYGTPDGLRMKKSIIAMVIFYIASYLFVYFIWTGNARMNKLRPVVSLVYNDLFVSKKVAGLTEKDLAAYRTTYQNLWQRVEGDSLWKFSDAKEGHGLPLYRIPTETLLNSAKLAAQREMKPNFILVLMESHRGLNTGYMNPQIHLPQTLTYGCACTPAASRQQAESSQHTSASRIIPGSHKQPILRMCLSPVLSPC